MFFDGTRRRLDLKGEQLPENVLKGLAKAVNLTERSGTAEIASETARFRLTFKFKAFFSI